MPRWSKDHTRIRPWRIPYSAAPKVEWSHRRARAYLRAQIDQPTGSASGMSKVWHFRLCGIDHPSCHPAQPLKRCRDSWLCCMTRCTYCIFGVLGSRRQRLHLSAQPDTAYRRPLETARCQRMRARMNRQCCRWVPTMLLRRPHPIMGAIIGCRCDYNLWKKHVKKLVIPCYVVPIMIRNGLGKKIGHFSLTFNVPNAVRDIIN